MSPLQGQVDSLVSGFVQEATEPRTLAALAVGGLAYRVGRIGVMGLRGGAYCNMPLRVASMAVGLGSEVTAFELTNRTWLTVGANLVFAPNEGRSQGSPLQNPSLVTRHASPNLWNWSGPGGWAEGLLTSVITFGMLRGAGFLAREENIVFQHAFQSTSMVAGHHAIASLGIVPRPEGNLAKQFLHAEVMNLQMGAGMGLLHSVVPGLNSSPSFFPSPLEGEGGRLRRMGEGGALPRNLFDPFLPQTVTAGSSLPLPLSLACPELRRREGEGNPNQTNVLMSSTENGNGGGRPHLYDRSPSLRRAGEALSELDPVSFIRHLRDLRPDFEKELGHRYALATLMEAVASGSDRLAKKRFQTFIYMAGATDLVEKLPDPTELIRYYSALPRSEIFLNLIQLKPYFQEFTRVAPGVGYLLLGLRVLGLSEAKDGAIDDTAIHYANTLDKAHKHWEAWGPHFKNLSEIPKKGESQGWTRLSYAQESLRKENGEGYATSGLNALIRWGIFLYENRRVLNLPPVPEIPLGLKPHEPLK